MEEMKIKCIKFMSYERGGLIPKERKMKEKEITAGIEKQTMLTVFGIQEHKLFFSNSYKRKRERERERERERA